MAVKLKKGADLNNNRLINLADGTAATDAVTLQQLQAAIRGLSWKDEVQVATTTNGALATAYANGQTIDGVTLATNMRILIKNQTTQTENGIYTVNASGAPTRAVDADSSAELESATVFVVAGTTNQNTAWTQTTDNPTIGTNNITFVQFGGGSSITAGNGLQGTTTFSILLDTASGLIVSGTGLKIDTSVVVRKFAQDCVATTDPQTFTDALGTDKQVQVWESNELVYPDITQAATSGGQTTVAWGSAPTTGQYRVKVQG